MKAFKIARGAPLRILLISVILTIMGAAAPHIQTISYPVFTIFEKEIACETRVKIAYFTDVVDFGVAGARGGATPSIPESAARAKESTLVAMATRALHVSANGAALAPVFDQLLFTFMDGDPAGVDEAKFIYHFTAPEPIQQISIRYDLFADHDPNHRAITKIRRGVSEKAVVLRRNDIFEMNVRDLGPESTLAAAGWFFIFGMEHIFQGWDHLLFLAGLILAARSLKSLFWIVTSFTLAHTITLVSAAMDWVVVSPAIVEPAIAASVAFVGIENLLRKEENNKRWLLAGAFGLVHGLGFAGFIHEAALPAGARAVCLGSFNLGVEAAQATVLCIAFPVVAAAREKLPPRVMQQILVIASLAITAAGATWLVLRIL